MYAILCGQMPFGGDDKDEVYQKIVDNDYQFNSPIWKNVSDEARQLIKMFLRPIP